MQSGGIKKGLVMVNIPSLRDLLEAGVHFGHKTSRWNPKMKSYIYGSKSGVHVINLEKTEEKLKEALDFLARIAQEGKTVIFVGTKKQAAEIVKKAAEDCAMPFVTDRWLGGMLTNFPIIQRAFKKLERAKIQRASSEYESLKKRDKVRLDKEIEKANKLIGGLINLHSKPDAIILIGSHDEKNALAEANKCSVPTVAIVDTNEDPDKVTYPIPANDDATKSITLFANLFSQVIKQNKNVVKVDIK